MIEIRVETREQIEQRCQALANRLNMVWDDRPMTVVAKLAVDKRTRAQNSLYWKWLGILGEGFTTPLAVRTKEDMHDMLRHKFLGTETVVIGMEEFERLPSTTKLGTAEMAQYMNRVEAWATDMGVLLPIPGENDYAKYREAMQ